MNDMSKADVADNQLILWQEPAKQAVISARELHLWRVDLELMKKSSINTSLLSQSEKDRSRRLVSPQKRDDFCAARAALRMILAGYLKLLPRPLKFGYSVSGKPFLIIPAFGQDLRFNLAHSGRWMLLGVCLGAEMGVDIEEVRMVDQSWALLHLYTEGERALINEMEGAERASVFTRIWTKKEAAAKADGIGLARYAAQTQSAGFSGALTGKKTITRENGFWVLSFEPAPGYLAAAAVRAEEIPQINYFEFNANI